MKKKSIRRNGTTETQKNFTFILIDQKMTQQIRHETWCIIVGGEKKTINKTE